MKTKRKLWSILLMLSRYKKLFEYAITLEFFVKNKNLYVIYNNNKPIVWNDFVAMPEYEETIKLKMFLWFKHNHAEEFAILKDKHNNDIDKIIAEFVLQ